MTKAAVWVRVSDPDQHTENQHPDLKRFVAARGWEVSQVYELQASAHKGDHQKMLSRVYQDAQQRKFDVLVCWALDRLSREGPLATLQIVDRLGKSGVQVISVQEPWTEAAGELRDLLLALVGWVARFESQRRSERTKAGLQRALAQGKKLGRPGLRTRRGGGGRATLLGMPTDQIIVCGFCGPFHVQELGQALDQTKEPFSLVARGRHPQRGDHHPAGGAHLRHHRQRDRHYYGDRTATSPCVDLVAELAVTDFADEGDIRDGSRTVILTLSEATWVAAGATFDARALGHHRRASRRRLPAQRLEQPGQAGHVRGERGPHHRHFFCPTARWSTMRCTGRPTAPQQYWGSSTKSGGHWLAGIDSAALAAQWKFR